MIPFATTILGGLHCGTVVLIQGKVPSKTDRWGETQTQILFINIIINPFHLKCWLSCWRAEGWPSGHFRHIIIFKMSLNVLCILFFKKQYPWVHLRHLRSIYKSTTGFGTVSTNLEKKISSVQNLWGGALNVIMHQLCLYAEIHCHNWITCLRHIWNFLIKRDTSFLLLDSRLTWPVGIA